MERGRAEEEDRGGGGGAEEGHWWGAGKETTKPQVSTVQCRVCCLKINISDLITVEALKNLPRKRRLPRYLYIYINKRSSIGLVYVLLSF